MKYLIRLFFKTLRAVLGPLLLLGDWLTSPRGIERHAVAQQQVDQQTQNLSLYQFRACPFCIKVRRAIKRLSLNIETRDAQHNLRHRAELLEGGGQIKVPCLRIIDAQGEVTWLYESTEIIQYLHANFDDREAVTA
ncbi:MAG: glutathione S-transferase N-terminal domain-containing protein [Gammaproteobacteria bacterium]